MTEPNSADPLLWSQFIRSLQVAEVASCQATSPQSAPLAVVEASRLYVVYNGVWGVEDASGRSLSVMFPGDVVFIARPTAHRVVGHEAGAEGAGLTWVTFRSLADTVFVPDCLPSLIVIREPALIHSQSDVFSVSTLDSKERFAAANALVRLVLALVLRDYRPVSSKNALTGWDDEIAQTVLLIRQQPEQPWTVERLAAEVNLSRSAFAEKFKNQTGQTPMQFLQNFRMEAASEHLRDGRHHLKEIARLTGYRSMSAFSAAFKKWSGQSPGDYRQAHNA